LNEILYKLPEIGKFFIYSPRAPAGGVGAEVPVFLIFFKKEMVKFNHKFKKNLCKINKKILILEIDLKIRTWRITICQQNRN
jgi:hypothetical protein